MNRSTIVDFTTRLIVQSGLVLSLYFLFAGHNQPGGGFIGGLVAGVTVALSYVAGGLDQVRALLRARPWSVIGAGLVLATGAAIAPALLGGGPLAQDYITWSLPVLGTVKATSALVFDTGVYAVVVGMVLMAFEALGEDEPPAEESP